MKKLILLFYFFKTIPMQHILFDLSEDNREYLENLKIRNQEESATLHRIVKVLRERNAGILNHVTLFTLYFPSHKQGNIFYGLFNTYQLRKENPSCNIVFVVNGKNQKINDEDQVDEDKDKIIGALRDNVYKEKIDAFLLKTKAWEPSINSTQYDPLVIFLD